MCPRPQPPMSSRHRGRGIGFLIVRLASEGLKSLARKTFDAPAEACVSRVINRSCFLHQRFRRATTSMELASRAGLFRSSPSLAQVVACRAGEPCGGKAPCLSLGMDLEERGLKLGARSSGSRDDMAAVADLLLSKVDTLLVKNLEASDAKLDERMT